MDWLDGKVNKERMKEMNQEVRMHKTSLARICNETGLSECEVRSRIKQYEQKRKCKVTARVINNIVHEYNLEQLFSGEWTNSIQYDGEYTCK